MKQKNHYSFKSLKKTMIAFAILLVPFSISAQNADSYKRFINNTGFAILEVQKAIRAGAVSNLDENLANLVRLQVKAIEQFNKKDYALAAYASSFSREEAIKLLIKLNGNANKFYTISDDEKKLFSSVSLQSNVDEITKQNSSTLSAKGGDHSDPNQIVKNVMIE
jgi:hypothetical protein